MGQADGVREDELEIFVQAMREVEEFARGERREFEVETVATGTAFQQRVWREIAGIPYGETVTYGEIAKRMGASSAVRAVGTAVGRNPLSLIVPCHRVVGSAGAMTGYAGGLDRKRRLLALEQEARLQVAAT
jgi:methylated-DNA-[protein]-cysteine S-methyltransferase